MTARALALAAACLVAALAAGCGLGDDNGGSGGGPNPNDKRAVAFTCITHREGLDARLAGEKSIQIDGPNGPRAEFFVSSGEAEALQFQGDAQGAQQIGAALLFVNGASDEVLEKVEKCLGEQ
jgi:hypothetical protein